MRKYAVILFTGIAFLLIATGLAAAEATTEIPEESIIYGDPTTEEANGLFVVTAASSGMDYSLGYERISITKDKTVVDMLNGVPAYYNKNGEGWDCYELITRYYKTLYGNRPYTLVETKTPRQGDVVYASGAQRSKSYGHYGIVKSYKDGVITLIEQNWDWQNNGVTIAAKERTIPFAASTDGKYGEFYGTYSVKTPVFKDGGDPVFDDGSGSVFRFNDVAEDYWAANDIYQLVELGIINGKSATLFKPTDEITRGEFAKILFMLSDADEAKYRNKTSFNDVRADAWYAPYIEWAYQNGVVLGFNGKFLPENQISRQEMAVMILRYVEEVVEAVLPQNAASTTFKDEEQIALWAKSAVANMQCACIITGYGDQTFKPLATAKRAEAVTMIARLLNADI